MVFLEFQKLSLHPVFIFWLNFNFGRELKGWGEQAVYWAITCAHHFFNGQRANWESTVARMHALMNDANWKKGGKKMYWANTLNKISSGLTHTRWVFIYIASSSSQWFIDTKHLLKTSKDVLTCFICIIYTGQIIQLFSTGFGVSWYRLFFKSRNTHNSGVIFPSDIVIALPHILVVTHSVIFNAEGAIRSPLSFRKLRAPF